MKVLAVLFFAIASVAGKGSGPYLPSGWRPDGPAFFLPVEVAKPSAAPVSELNLQGSEASGSDFLQEYGPPKVQEVSQNLINQGLPDVAIEQLFGAVAQVAEVVTEATTDKVVEANTEPISTEAAATESSVDSDSPISAELPILDFVVQEATVSNIDQTTEQTVDKTQSNQEVSVSSEYQQETSTATGELEKVTSSVGNVERVTASVDTEVSPVNVLIPATSVAGLNVPQVQNIPDIIASLEQEILTQQAEVNQAVSEITSIQGSTGSLDVPEGFLEYGPPGFAEYGPPKVDQEVQKNLQATESNETRRRRFSPKFRPARKH